MTIPAFLSESQLQQHSTAAGLDPAAISSILALAARIRTTATLQQCAVDLYAQTYEGAPAAVDPTPEALFGDDLPTLYLLVAIDAIRRLRIVHQARGIPEAITRESYGALPMCARRYAEAHNGAIGIEASVLRSWLGKTVASGNLYRLGRLEFILKAFNGNLRIYRHKRSGQLQAMAEAGVRFTADGYLPFVFDEPTYTQYGWPSPQASADEWIATLEEDEQQVTGTPISPKGYAMPTTAQLAKAEWELLLCNGDTVLDMHIPNFMPLHLELLHDSLRRALEFFPRYHAERPFKAFACGSWIFNTQFIDMLPPTSNLLAFQRQGYLFPILSNGAGGIYFLFGQAQIDLATAPQDSTLRRAVIAHMQAGGQLRNGGFLLLPDDVARFGQEPYR